jgi:hypothetical protein
LPTNDYSLIYGGVFDVIKAANCAIFGKTFSLKQHIYQKAFAYSLSFVLSAAGSYLSKIKLTDQLEKLAYGGMKLKRNVSSNVLAEYISGFFDKSSKSKKYNANQIFIENQIKFLEQQTEEILRNNNVIGSLRKDENSNQAYLNDIREKLRKTLEEPIIYNIENLFPNLDINTLIEIKKAILNEKIDFKEILRKYDKESNTINQDLKSIVDNYEFLEDSIKEKVENYIKQLKISQKVSDQIQQIMEKNERQESIKQVIVPIFTDHIDEQIEKVENYIKQLKISQKVSDQIQQIMEKNERQESIKQLIVPIFTDHIEEQIEENNSEKVKKNIIDCRNEIKKNSFNQSENSKYLYTSVDIRGIINQMNYDAKDNLYHSVSLNSDSVHLDEEFISNDVLFVYNIENSHWISVACLSIDQKNLVVLIKNSLDYSHFDCSHLENIFRTLKPNNDFEFKYNRAKEQDDATSCGIFAMQNLKIMAENLRKNRMDFINKFENFSEFCNQEDAVKLRKTDFANKFALNMFIEIYNQKLDEAKRELIDENHDSEIKEIIRLMNENLRLKELIPELSINNEDESQNNSIFIEIGLDSDIKENYDYKYRLKFNYKDYEGIMNEAKTILADILKIDFNKIKINKNLIEIDHSLVKNIQLKEKLKPSGISNISKEDTKFVFGTSLQNLYIEHTEYKRCFDILKESKLFDDETIEGFNESLNELTVQINQKINQENALKAAGFSPEDIEKYVKMSKFLNKQ